MSPAEASQTQRLLNLVQTGDEQARAELMNRVCRRLENLTRRMLRGYPKVHRWEQTDDVLQNAMLRLHRALATARIDSVRHFWRLAAIQIRRELLDLAKHYQGPQGPGANHHTDGIPADGVGGSLQDKPAADKEPASIGEWTDFHERVEQLPDDEREVFSLLWYEGLTQDEAAAILEVTVRTIKRRWQNARLLMHRALEGEPPTGDV